MKSRLSVKSLELFPHIHNGDFSTTLGFEIASKIKNIPMWDNSKGSWVVQSISIRFMKSSHSDPTYLLSCRSKYIFIVFDIFPNCGNLKVPSVVPIAYYFCFLYNFFDPPEIQNYL